MLAMITASVGKPVEPVGQVHRIAERNDHERTEPRCRTSRD
jgi:hypothetical protein